MKNFVNVSLMVMVLCLACYVPAMAGGSLVDLSNNQTATATGINGGVHVSGGQGGTAFGGTAFGGTAFGGKATIEKGAVKNTNTNFGINAQKQGQKQQQGQQQGQVAFGGNANANHNGNNNGNLNGNNNGNNNGHNGNFNGNNANNADLTVNQNFEAKRDHLMGPGVMNPDVKFTDGKRFHAKTMGSVWNRVAGLKYTQAKKIWSGASDSDVEIKKAVMFEMDYRTKYINKGKSGDFMGYLVVVPNGNDVSVAGMEAKAAITAMKLGATHMVRMYLNSGDHASGKSWGIGLGGGASIISHNDGVAIAPTGGLGVSGAKAYNESLPEMVFELYSDENLVKELNK